MDKKEYYRQLYALNDSSDGEQDTNDAREVMKQSAQPLSSSFPVPSPSPASRRRQLSRKSGKMPALHHTTSAPVTSSSVIRETPIVTRKSRKLLYDKSSNPEANEQPSSAGAPPTPTLTPAPGRSASTPNLDFAPNLVMTNSIGIGSLLKKSNPSINFIFKKSGAGKDTTTKKDGLGKRKRDKKNVPVPDDKQVFAGKTFFFIPNDDISKVRKARITSTRDYGAVWAREWTPDITHIIVDKIYKYEQIMNFLKPMMKADEIPAHIILVNEEYPIDCIEFGCLVNETQGKYLVERRESPSEEQESQSPSTGSEILKPKSKKKQDTQDEHTQRSEPSTQPPIANHSRSSSSSSLHISDADDGGRVEDPRQRSPMLDTYHGLSSKLDEWLKVAHEYQNFPLSLDDDEDYKEDNLSSSTEYEYDTDRDSSSEEEYRPRKHQKKKRYTEAQYFCMIGGTGLMVENNPNEIAINILERMAEYYDRIKDEWRPQAYRKAIGMLKKIPVKIRTYDQAYQIPHIGKRLAAKIEEVVLTGRLRRLENAELEPEDQILQIFLKIYGVGTREASKFIQAGYKTLDDLRTRARLTKGQRIGLDHYDDFNTRIPRDEVTALGDIVKATIKSIDPEVQAIIGGSYRRGAKDSGDIDFILTKPDTDRARDLLPFLHTLVARLKQTGFLTCELATPSFRDTSGSKWHGACVLPGNPIWRRIDFLLVPETEMGAALIYFTGDDIFNRSIRLLARHKGYGLNQRGLIRIFCATVAGRRLQMESCGRGETKWRSFGYWEFRIGSRSIESVIEAGCLGLYSGMGI